MTPLRKLGSAHTHIFCYMRIVDPYLFKLLRQGFLLQLNIPRPIQKAGTEGGIQFGSVCQSPDQNGSNGLGAKTQDTLSEQPPYGQQEFLFTYSGPLNAPVLGIGETKGWGGFLEDVDLPKSVNVRWKTTLFLGQSSLFQSCLLCIFCLHLLTRYIPASWASEGSHSVGGRWKSQTSHSWFTWADLAICFLSLWLKGGPSCS